MNEKIPFPVITAVPCNLDNVWILDAFSESECNPDIIFKFRKHIINAHRAHGYIYPTEPKELYVVPFSQIRESRQLGLRPPQFAMLWLTSIAIDIHSGIERVPQELMESPIVAWDNEFSILEGNKVLHLDPGLGKVLFVMSSNLGFDFNPNWQFLAEAI